MKLEELQQLKKEKEIKMGKIDQVVKEDKKLKKHAGILYQMLNERTSIANELKVIDIAIKGKELNRDLVGLLKEIKERLEISFDDDLYEKTTIVLEKAEGAEIKEQSKREKWEFYCPCCDIKMKTRIEEVLSDAFVSGKEKIVTGWDCENCHFSLNVDEN